MKTPPIRLLVIALAAFGPLAGFAPAQSLSTNAERVLQYLEDQRGLKTLAGQEEAPLQLTADQQFILGVTGKRPAMRGWDIRGDNPSPIMEARNSWMNYNQLVEFSWHMGYPPNADSFNNSKLPSDPTVVSAAIDQMLTPGTSLNLSFLAKLDSVAAQLRTLKNEDVPVLWRPFHEGESYSGNPNRSSFWWGKAGPTQYKRLWRFMFDYYRTTKGLTHLIWVYSALDNPNSGWTGTGADWFPGDDYVHVVGTDVYDGTWSSYHNYLATLAPGLPVALTENDIIPDPAVMQANNTLWSWFLSWHSTYVQMNSNAHLSYVYNHALVITADEMPDLKNLAPAANPTFSLPGGSYVGAQTIAISTTTSGASLRYTTDGSTPSASAGTVYAGPITLGATATLKAIAYKSGLTNSAVTSATYTITAGGGASKLAVSAVTASANDGNLPSGTIDGSLATRWAAQGDPQWIQFDLGATKNLTSIKHAWYNGNARVYTFDVQTSTNGSSFTTVLTGAQNNGTSLNLETLALPGGASGRYVRLVCHGSNASTWNSITELEIWGGGGSTPPPTVTAEAEGLSPAGSGATVTIESDPPAGGGQWVKLASTGAGQYLQFTTPSLVAGTYQLELRYKTATSRAQHSVSVDGTTIGGTVDEYAAGTSTYATVTLGTRTFSSAGAHTIRLTVTGKNASSSGYLLGVDSFTFIGQ